MDWPGQASFNRLGFHNWKVMGQTVGQAKTFSGLTSLHLDGAGHMVPHDKPEAAFAMLETFIHNGTF